MDICTREKRNENKGKTEYLRIKGRDYGGKSEAAGCRGGEG